MKPDDHTVTTQFRVDEDPRSLRRWIWGVAAFTIFAVSVTGMVVQMPYVAFMPGEAIETEERLELTCSDGPECLTVFPSDGEVYFTTVSVRQRPSFWEYLWLKNDDDVMIDDIESILGDRTPQENDQFNSELMTQSKDLAVSVALEKLGYDAIKVTAVLVAATIEDTAAAGVLEPGDRLMAVNEREITNTDDLFEVLSDVEPGDSIELAYARMVDGDEQFVDKVVKVGANPEDPTRPFIGIQPFDQFDFVEFDFGVAIDSSDVGGPSAGLAFTLATLDYLTEGDLTGGNNVAVTGTIRPDGSVGPVGGVLQKAAAVRDQGIELFIVPASLPVAELDLLEDQAGEGLEIRTVETLDDALDALEDNGGDVDAVNNYVAEDV